MPHEIDWRPTAIRTVDSIHQRFAYRRYYLRCESLVRLAFAPVPRRCRGRIVP